MEKIININGKEYELHWNEIAKAGCLSEWLLDEDGDNEGDVIVTNLRQELTVTILFKKEKEKWIKIWRELTKDL